MAGYSDAIASIESGGRYDRVGPTHPTMGRALGRYQVMESNVGPWTRQHLGQELTPDQFLASPQAQDAVFNGQFGQYAKKYGPEGAARAWFAGEGGMNNPNAKDSLGTSVSDYAAKFNAAMGGGDSPAAPPMSPGLLAGAGAPPDNGLMGGLLGRPGGQSQQPNFAGLMQAGMNQMAPQQQQAPMPMPMQRRPIDLSQLRAMLSQPQAMAGWGLG